jgi:hypothetical protein
VQKSSDAQNENAKLKGVKRCVREVLAEDNTQRVFLDGAICKARSHDDNIENGRVRVGDREVARGVEIARKDCGDLNIQATVNSPAVGRDEILNANPALLNASAILVVVGRELGDSVGLTLGSIVVALDSEDGVLASDKPCTKKKTRVRILKQMGVEVGVLELSGEQSALCHTAGAMRQLKKWGLVEGHHARHGEARDRLLHVEEKPALGVRRVANIVQRATARLQPKGGGITNVGECGRAEDANSRKIRQRPRHQALERGHTRLHRAVCAVGQPGAVIGSERPKLRTPASGVQACTNHGEVRAPERLNEGVVAMQAWSCEPEQNTSIQNVLLESMSREFSCTISLKGTNSTTRCSCSRRKSRSNAKLLDMFQVRSDNQPHGAFITPINRVGDHPASGDVEETHDVGLMPVTGR